MNTKKLLPVFIVLFIVAVVTMILLHQMMRTKFQERDYEAIRKSGAINVVSEYNLEDYYISGDSIDGRQYDLCRFIANQSGLDVHIFLENDLATCIKGLEDKQYDVIARSIPITNENRQYLNFTVPISRNKQVLIQRIPAENDSVKLIRNQLDLAYQTLYLPKGSSTVLRLKNLSEEIAEPIYMEEVENHTQEQLMYMVAYREIDYTVVDRGVAEKTIRNFPELDMETEISFTQLQAWAVRESSPALLDSLNRWIEMYNQAQKGTK